MSDEEASKRGKRSRNKGKRGERNARDWLKEMGFLDARRTAQHKGTGTSDVECPESLPNVHIEVKLWASFNARKLREACFQADRDKAVGQRMVVIWRTTEQKQAKQWRMCYLYKGRVMSLPPILEVCRRKLLELNNG
jgi:hypothetical protein